MKDLPTQQELNELFTYINGVLLHKKGSKAGKLAMKSGRNGYYMIAVGRDQFMAHRVIFTMFNGQIHAGAVIDHMNREKSDCRIENLRAVNPQVNAENCMKSDKRNLSGIRGVHMKTRGSETRYYARISIGGKTVALGAYKTAEEAGRAYVDAKAHMHEGFFAGTN